MNITWGKCAFFKTLKNLAWPELYQFKARRVRGARNPFPSRRVAVSNQARDDQNVGEGAEIWSSKEATDAQIERSGTVLFSHSRWQSIPNAQGSKARKVINHQTRPGRGD